MVGDTTSLVSILGTAGFLLLVAIIAIYRVVVVSRFPKGTRYRKWRAGVFFERDMLAPPDAPPDEEEDE